MNYKYFNDSKDYFNYIDNKLESGIKIEKSIGLGIFFSDGEIVGLKPINKTSDLKEKKKPYVIPSYKNESVINVIAGIRANFGYKSKYDYDPKIFNKSYNHVVYLLLDGLGVNILKECLPEDSFLRSNYYKTVSAIYPSTTAAATTSAKSGLYPLESGWTGWHNYIKEVNKNLILFTGIDYYSKEYTGINMYKLLPYDLFFDDMVVGEVIEPDFSKSISRLDVLLRRSIKNLSKSRFQYVYYNYPDEILHLDGIDGTKTKAKLLNIDRQVKNYVDRLPDNTLLIISADHGHTSCSPLNISNFRALNSLLERKPSNDARCITFKVKPEKIQEFETLFNTIFGSEFLLYKSNDIIKLGMLGDPKGKISPRIKDFMADYTALAVGNYYFKNVDDDVVFKSHHAGITKDEMEVPLIVIKK